MFLFARIPAHDFGKVTIFFAVLSIYLTAGHGYLSGHLVWNFILGRYRRRRSESTHVESDNDEQSMKVQLIAAVNKRGLDEMMDILRYYHSVAPKTPTSVRLEELHYTQMVISTHDGLMRYPVPFQPPLENFDQVRDRFREMAIHASSSLREGSVGGESDITSIMGRLRHSRKLFLKAAKMQQWRKKLDTRG